MSVEMEHSIVRDDEVFAAVGEAVGHIAHDFNNLLTPLLAYPQLLRRELAEGSKGHRLLDAIEHTTRNMAHITSQMLCLSSRDELDFAPVNINDICERVGAGFKSIFEQSGLNLQLDLDTGIGLIRGSESHLTTSVACLCDNAVDAMPDGGLLTVKTRQVDITESGTVQDLNGDALPPGSYIAISVSDEGEGIPEIIKDKAFEPFVTTKKQSSNRGAGLGLTVLYRVVRGHGGHVMVDTGPAGTTIDLYLPNVRD